VHPAGRKHSRRTRRPAWSCAPPIRLLWLTVRSPISNGLQWTWRACGRSLYTLIVEAHNETGLFQRVGEFPIQTDAEFPVAQGAVNFYKNGSPFLNKYLPFWIVPHVLRLFAVLLAGDAIIYPLFSFAPKLYQ